MLGYCAVTLRNSVFFNFYMISIYFILKEVKKNFVKKIKFLTTLPSSARKILFPKPWNITENSKRPGKYHLSVKCFAEKKHRISHLRKVQNKNFSVISKYHLSIKFLAKKKTVFSIHKKFQNKNFLVTSKHDILY